MARGFGSGLVFNRDSLLNPVGAGGATDVVRPTAFVLTNNYCTMEAWIQWDQAGWLCQFLNSGGFTLFSVQFTQTSSPTTFLALCNWQNAAGANEQWFNIGDVAQGYVQVLGVGPGSAAPRFQHFMVAFNLDSSKHPRVWLNGEQCFETSNVATNNGAKLADSTVVTATSSIGNGNGTTSPFNGMIERFRVYNDALGPDAALAHSQGRNLNDWDHALALDVDMRGDAPVLIDSVTQTILTVAGTRIWDIEGPKQQMRARRTNFPTPTWTRYSAARRVYGGV